jgi:branched-chain amino acid transport system permease protein
VIAGIASIVLATGVYWLLNRTSIGSQMLAVAENREGAMLMGIRPDRMQALTWGISAGSAGIAGGFLATFFYISPGIGETFVLLAFVVVCLGGFGSVPGAIVAGVIIGLVQGFSGYLLGSNFSNMVVFALFLAVLWIRPQGLFGRTT